MKKPNLLVAILPLVVLIIVLTLSVKIFGDDMTAGPSQIALLSAAMLSCLIGVYFLKVPWKNFEEHIGQSFKDTSIALVIVLLIGAITSSWMLSGIVPTIICYGLQIINPKVMLAASFLLCAIVGFMLGSSWTTIGTIGVAMLGAGQIVGLPGTWMAGAIISGAYLGDKLSPLSDTTIMSSTVAKVDLYRHIRFMLTTTVPAAIVAFVVFLIVGFTFDVSSGVEVDAQIGAITGTFRISPWLLLIPAATVFMLIKKVNVLLTLFVSALLGAVTALFAQPHVVSQITDPSTPYAPVATVLSILAQPNTVDTGSDMVNTLASTGGMAKMLNTVWIIMSVLVFGGAMEASGMLQTITGSILRFAKSSFALITTTIAACFCCELVLADQYNAILVPGNMFNEAFRKKGLAPEVLSRSLEDGGTVLSVLVPWNSCGAMQASVLGIATLAYAPYCIFNIVSPIIAIAIAAFGYKTRYISQTTNE